MKLPLERLERVEAWGMSSASAAYVYRPPSVERILEAFSAARELGRTIALKGAGNSYGDAFQNAEGMVIDLSRMNRILSWDPQRGVVKCEPGVTIRDLWRYTIADAWWPPVVSGTSLVTIGGAVSANIHGKNNFHTGPIGEHVLQFDLLAPSGDVYTCSPTQNEDIFKAAIGGFGLLGVITSIDLQMTKLNSGFLNVQAFSVPNWASTFDVFENNADRFDYLVGWLDCFKGGDGAGRGLIHGANYKSPGEDAHPEESLSIRAQELPDTSFGWVARSRLYRLMGLLINKSDMAMVNWAKYVMGRRENGKRISQPIVEFNFLLDSAPNWKWAYKPGGLIQYQPFVPKDRAAQVFHEITRLSRERNQPPFLAVMKRHRPDNFLLSHAVDGYSLALDYPINPENRDWLLKLCRDMDQIVLDAGGRFYFAKDSTLNQESARRYLGDGAIGKFTELKRRLDPELLLQTELSKRTFGRFERPAAENGVIKESLNAEKHHEGWAESPESPEASRKIGDSVNLEVPE